MRAARDDDFKEHVINQVVANCSHKGKTRFNSKLHGSGRSRVLAIYRNVSYTWDDSDDTASHDSDDSMDAASSDSGTGAIGTDNDSHGALATPVCQQQQQQQQKQGLQLPVATAASPKVFQDQAAATRTSPMSGVLGWQAAAGEKRACTQAWCQPACIAVACRM